MRWLSGKGSGKQIVIPEYVAGSVLLWIRERALRTERRRNICLRVRYTHDSRLRDIILRYRVREERILSSERQVWLLLCAWILHRAEWSLDGRRLLLLLACESGLAWNDRWLARNARLARLYRGLLKVLNERLFRLSGSRRNGRHGLGARKVLRSGGNDYALTLDNHIVQRLPLKNLSNAIRQTEA